MSTRLRRLFTIAVVLPLVLMMASVTLLLWRLNELAVLSRWVDHSDRVLAAVTGAQRSVSDIEVGYRGFLLSRSDVFLEPYVGADRRIRAELSALSAMVVDNDVQLELARKLQSEAQAWADKVGQSLTQFRGDDEALGDHDQVMRSLIADKAELDRVHLLITDFTGRERELRRLRTEAATQATRRTFWLTAVLLSAVGVLLAWLSRRQLASLVNTYEDALTRAVKSETVEREARETAQAAVLARDNFVSLVSHELKTPLTSLRLQLQTLLKHAERGQPVAPERIVTKADASLRQVDRLAQLVNDLMDVARLASGHMEVTVREIDAAALVRRVLDEFEDDAHAAGCAVALDSAGDVPVCADPMRLEQVVVNLLTNALKYGRGQPIEVRVTRESGRACISFGDHGIGIAPQEQTRIFERFARADGAQTFTGVGLGLYIAQNLLELMEGEITVESELGAGSTFRIFLPLASATN